MLFLTQPGGEEGYFRTMMSSLASNMELPEEVETYSTTDVQGAIELGTKYGLVFLDPQRTKVLLPGFYEAQLSRVTASLCPGTSAAGQ